GPVVINLPCSEPVIESRGTDSSHATSSQPFYAHLASITRNITIFGKCPDCFRFTVKLAADWFSSHFVKQPLMNPFESVSFRQVEASAAPAPPDQASLPDPGVQARCRPAGTKRR